MMQYLEKPRPAKFSNGHDHAVTIVISPGRNNNSSVPFYIKLSSEVPDLTLVITIIGSENKCSEVLKTVY